jgi:hypothetical protein
MKVNELADANIIVNAQQNCLEQVIILYKENYL